MPVRFSAGDLYLQWCPLLMYRPITDWTRPTQTFPSLSSNDGMRVIQSTSTPLPNLPPSPNSECNSTVVIRRSSLDDNADEPTGPGGDGRAMPPWLFSSLSSRTPSTDVSGVFTPAPDDSTTKMSIDSRFSPSSIEAATPSDSGRSMIQKAAAVSSELGGLGTIQESPLDRVKPTVETVERASAAKIHLETYFYERLSKPNRREICLQHLESNILQSNMSPGQRHALWDAFNAQWTWHLRETRVLMTKSAKAAKGESAGPRPDDYEPLKLLGKGSFGVVKLVCEKPKPENSFRRQVYAMKVIRKSDMIRNSQEGHLRAERDLLAAAEGSNW